MAQVFAFTPYRYTRQAGRLSNLVTQPYDKISPEMQARYLAASPYNIVRIILGERYPSDTSRENVYTRAARHFEEWIKRGILARDSEPAFYAYFQDFRVPDTGERMTRKGFIGLGKVEDYSAGVVHRHEQTLTGPKRDRMEVLRHARAHFGQIFMLYPDRAGSIDAILDEAAQPPAAMDVTDEYGTQHCLWRISDQERIRNIAALMSDKKLLIADGHHRYETALAFRNENPGWEAASRTMMTFVNMYSPGLRILATHRVVSGLPRFYEQDFWRAVRDRFAVQQLDSRDDLERAFASNTTGRIGVAMANRLYLVEAGNANRKLDITLLHEDILEPVLGIGQDAVREEQNVRYIRGIDAAIEEVRNRGAQIAFLLKPTSIDQVADVSFGGGVMPQKSTDFYPKLLSGLTIYKLD
jgi:uncharacterized protein (DUF1015 family)